MFTDMMYAVFLDGDHRRVWISWYDISGSLKGIGDHVIYFNRDIQILINIQ